jgi:hypothetical protein
LISVTDSENTKVNQVPPIMNVINRQNIVIEIDKVPVRANRRNTLAEVRRVMKFHL